MDLGLWAGLTEDQLKMRYATAHRQLLESPLNVSPPGGEDFSQAANRLRNCLRKRVKPNSKAAIGLVLRSLAFVLARCVLEGTGPTGIWEASQRESEPLVMECLGVPDAIAGA